MFKLSLCPAVAGLCSLLGCARAEKGSEKNDSEKKKRKTLFQTPGGRQRNVLEFGWGTRK